MFSLTFTTGVTAAKPCTVETVDAAALLKAWIFSLLHQNPNNSVLVPLLEMLQNKTICFSGTHLKLNPTQSTHSSHQVVPVAIYARTNTEIYYHTTRRDLVVLREVKDLGEFEYAIAFQVPGTDTHIQWFQSSLSNPGLPLLNVTQHLASAAIPLPAELSFLAPVISFPGAPIYLMVHGIKEPEQPYEYDIDYSTLEQMGLTPPFEQDIRITATLSPNQDYSGFIFNCTLTDAASAYSSHTFLTFQVEEHLANTDQLASLFFSHLECFVAAYNQKEHLRSLLKPLLGELVAYTDTSGSSTQQSWKTLDDYYHFQWNQVDSSSPQYQLQVFSVATNHAPLHLLPVDTKKAVDTTVLDSLAADIILETQLRPSSC